MLKHDTVCLRHMLDAVREAEHFIRGKTRVVLTMDRKLELALGIGGVKH